MAPKTKRSISAERQTAPPAEPPEGRPAREDIASRAYDLFLKRGGQHGHD